MNEIDLLAIDVSKLPEVLILNNFGAWCSGYRLINGKPDKTGLLAILDPSGQKVLKFHPSRMKEDGEIGSPAVVCDGRVIAPCPQCGMTYEVSEHQAVCSQHGEFIVILENIPKQAKKLVGTDLSDLAKLGELWFKKAAFDSPGTEVMAVTLRVETRYISFNLYNGSFGRKGNKPPIDDLVAGKAGYVINNEEKWRKKLQIKGYMRFE